MNFEMVKAWLTRENGRQIRASWFWGFLGLALTPIALAVTMGLVYVILIAAKRHSDPFDRTSNSLLTALGVLPVLFVINYFLPRDRGPEKYYHEGLDDTSSSTLVENRARHYGLLPYDSRSLKIQATILLWILFTGPRLVNWSISSFREIARLKRLDVHSCAAVLWLLMIKHKKVPFPDIQAELDWLDLNATLPQLMQIKGVLLPQMPPPGLSLSDDLRTAIRTGGEAP